MRKNAADGAEANTLPERVLEQKAENPRGDRADDEQPAELRVGVVRADPAVAQAPPEPFQDPHPVAPEEEEQDDRSRQMSRDEEGDEVLVVLVDIPAESLRDDDAVPEARDREELGHALEEPEHDRLPVADQRGGDHVPEAAGRCFLPVWNQANTSSASPTRNGGDPVLDVVLARARLVARDERRQRAGRLDPVHNREDDQGDADDDGSPDSHRASFDHLPLSVRLGFHCPRSAVAP